MRRAVPDSTVIIREADDAVRRSVEPKMLKLWNTESLVKPGNDSPICERIARRRFPENERPVRGDNRTGQAIWALGWMGARAEYSLDGEGITAPT